jgi:hypothetical protein
MRAFFSSSGVGRVHHCGVGVAALRLGGGSAASRACTSTFEAELGIVLLTGDARGEDLLEPFEIDREIGDSLSALLPLLLLLIGEVIPVGWCS